MGILNRTPDSFYDKGPRTSSTPSEPGPSSWWPKAPTSSTSAVSRPVPGPEVTETEEMDRVRAVDGRPGRSFRGPDLRRHLAGLGGPGLLRARAR